MYKCFKKRNKFHFHIHSIYCIFIICIFYYIFCYDFCLTQIYLFKCAHFSYRKKSIDGFFISLITTANSTRQNITYRKWMKSIENTKHQALFISNEANDIPGNKYIVYSHQIEQMVNMNQSRRDREILLKRFIGMKYFLENTSYKWYLCTSDDVFIKIENLDLIVQELNSKYDTFKDHVILGHCIELYKDNKKKRKKKRKKKYEKMIYLQGGSGYIMSRYTAQAIVDLGTNFISTVNIYDDLAWTYYIKLFNLTSSAISSPYLYGHIHAKDRIMKQKTYPICPNISELPKTQCYGQQLFKAETLSVFHCSDLKILYRYVTAWNSLMKRYPNLYYYYGRVRINYCVK